MKKDLKIGGIYRFGLDGSSAKPWIVIGEEKEKIIVHTPGCYMEKSGKTKEEIINCVKERIKEEKLENSFFAFNDDKSISNKIQGFYGVIPEEMLRKLKIEARKEYPWLK